MEQIKSETFEEMINRFLKAAKTLTPDQIEAFQWVIGTDGWTKEPIVEYLERELEMVSRHRKA